MPKENFIDDEKITYSLKYALNLTTIDPTRDPALEEPSPARIFPTSITKTPLIEKGVGDINEFGVKPPDKFPNKPWNIIKMYKIIDPIHNKVSKKTVLNVLGSDNKNHAEFVWKKADEPNDPWHQNRFFKHWFHDYNTYPYDGDKINSIPPNDWKGLRLAYGKTEPGTIVIEGGINSEYMVPHISLYLGVPLTIIDTAWKSSDYEANTSTDSGKDDTASWEHDKSKGRFLLNLLGLSDGFETRVLKWDMTELPSETCAGKEGSSWLTNSGYGMLTFYGITYPHKIKGNLNTDNVGFDEREGYGPRISFCRYIGETVNFDNPSVTIKQNKIDHETDTPSTLEKNGTVIVDACYQIFVVNDGSYNLMSSASIESGSQEPSDPTDGDLFINTNDKTLKRYDGSQWASIGGGGSGTVSYFRDLNDLALFDNSGYLYYNHDNKDFPLGVKDLSELFRLSEMLVVNDAGQTFFEVLTEQPRFFQDSDTVFQNMVFGEDYIDIHWTYDRILPRGAVSNAFQHYFSLFGTPKMTLPVINKIVYEVYISSYFINKRFEVICNRNYNDYDEFKTIRITYQQINDIIVDELGIQEFDILIYGVNNNNNYPSQLAQDGVNVEQNLRCIRLNQVRFVNTDNALSFDSKIYVDGEWKIQILNTNEIKTIEKCGQKYITEYGYSQTFQNSENNRKENINLTFVWLDQKFFDLMDGIENVEHHYINLYATLQNSKRCKRIYPIDKGEKVTRIYHKNKRIFDQNTGLLLADASKSYYTVREDTIDSFTIIDISLNNNFLNLGSRYDIQIVIRTTHPYYMITNKSDIIHLDYTDPPIITPLNNIETQIQNFYSDYVYFREENMTNRTYTINYQKAFKIEETEPSYILISPHKDHDNTALITSNTDNDSLNIIIEGETYKINSGENVTTIDYRFNSYTDYGYNDNDNGIQIIQNDELIEKYPIINLLDNRVYDYNNFVVVESIWYRDKSNIYMKLNTDISNIINKDVSFTIVDNISRTSNTFNIDTDNIEYNIDNKYDINDEKYDEDPNYKHYIIKINLGSGGSELLDSSRSYVDIKIYWKFGFQDISNETHEGVKYILNNTEINDGVGEDLTVHVNVSTDVNKGEDLLKQVDIYDLTMNMDQYNAKITFNGFDVDSISTVTDIFVSDVNDYDPHINKQMPHPADPTVMINFDDEKRKGFHLDGQFKLNINRLIEQNEIIKPMEFNYSYDKWNGLKENNRSWNNIFNIDTNDKFPIVYYKRNEIIDDNYRRIFGNPNLLNFKIKSYRIYENINSKFLENTQYEDVYLNFHSRRFDGFGRQKARNIFLLMKQWY